MPCHPDSLVERLRLMVITRPDPGGGDLRRVVEECVEAGATAIQLRDKLATTRGLYETAAELCPIVRSRGALFLVNDRFDVALASGADGVHVGPHDIPVAAVREQVPRAFVIGYSTDDPDIARRAEADGADYLGVGALFGTLSKPGLSEEAIGTSGLRAVMEAVRIPCVGIGGVTPANAPRVAATGAGIVVLSAVMDSAEPAGEVAALRAAVEAARGGGAQRG